MSWDRIQWIFFWGVQTLRGPIGLSPLTPQFFFGATGSPAKVDSNCGDPGHHHGLDHLCLFLREGTGAVLPSPVRRYTGCWDVDIQPTPVPESSVTEQRQFPEPRAMSCGFNQCLWLWKRSNKTLVRGIVHFPNVGKLYIVDKIEFPWII